MTCDPSSEAPGLTADWLNAWLAAIGVTVLVEGARLRWSGARRPVAIVDVGTRDLAVTVAAALPAMAYVGRLAIASPNGEFPRNVTTARFGAAAAKARSDANDFSLAVSVTDLVSSEKLLADLPHSEFDPPAPRGETLWTRLEACRTALPSDQTGVAEAVRATLAGRAERKKLNGLGFDARRLVAGDPTGSDSFVDPMVEFLAFFGLSLVTVRGDGRRRGLTRGWRAIRAPSASPKPKAPRAQFVWPVWSQPLDRWGIDALLTFAWRRSVKAWTQPGFGITAAFQAVPYRKPLGSNDVTRGYASRELWLPTL